jgi:hypothetical protein
MPRYHINENRDSTFVGHGFCVSGHSHRPRHSVSARPRRQTDTPATQTAEYGCYRLVMGRHLRQTDKQTKRQHSKEKQYEEGISMRISHPLQPMAPLIVLALGSLSIVSLAQGIVSLTSGANIPSITEVIAGLIGIALSAWIIAAMRATRVQDEEDDEDYKDDESEEIKGNNLQSSSADSRVGE